MNWIATGDEKYSNDTGRFDVFLGYERRWVALDAERGRIEKFAALEDAKDWCRGQLLAHERTA